MYLTEPKFLDIVRQQFRFKMNANASAFTKLIFLQLACLFISNYRQAAPGYNSIEVSEQLFSNTAIVVATWLWAFFVGLLLTIASQRNESFTFVTNRFSYHGSNFLFMLCASIIGGLTAVLMGSVLKLYNLLQFENIIISSKGLFAAPADFFIQLMTAIAYTMLFFMVSYAIGMFIQRNKAFLLLFIVGWITLSIIGGFSIIQPIFDFFWNEHSITIFLLKVSGTILGLFAIATAITNRLEVKK
ncbi:hypothetical protein [Sporosarcina beigongshangi]|uniref:hypothetical protein n=1 Tax=Sporosarcina beigongshangi TaxID=2782538 RepID=UPI00193A0067|nr:hypothetical protein [Sporosarcina beigongshangi]